LAKLPEDLRNKVWTNTKLHRRAGCRAVPYGVFKNSKGEYKPFDENLSTEELAALFEVKL
ncbi:MAG: Tat pathway signal protein, partial [Sutterella sp.]|nr:Tat pathway signal protein [Sutterella sp.]